jgi:uncharacterized protein (TIGR03086 family)
MDVPDLHKRACDEFGRRVHGIGDDQWELPTPNEGWTVRDLVQHLVSEAVWTAPLMAGQTIAEVGDRFDGDLLGDDPVAAWDKGVAEAVESVTPEAMTRTVHLSFGDFPGEEYAMQLFCDNLIHAWDLARATGQDERLDSELVSACAAWFASREDAYRAAGAIGERPPTADGADELTKLLAMTGRKA